MDTNDDSNVVVTEEKVMDIPIEPRHKKVRRKCSKKGAIHHHGEHFKPVHLFFHDDKPMTPAMYRRLHKGAQKRKHGPRFTL